MNILLDHVTGNTHTHTHTQNKSVLQKKKNSGKTNT